MADGAEALWRVLCDRVDFFGVAGKAMPTGAALEQALRDGALLLPRAYADTYVTPVQTGLPKLLALSEAGRIRAQSVEMVTGAIAQHAAGATLTTELRRFTAVVSNLYQSFLDDARRADARMPLRSTLPPLAAFAHNGSDGPITIGVDLIDQVLGAKAGVVSLPATFAAHPILWAALAHETGGHDVTHADDGLLDELDAGIAGVLAGLDGEAGLPAGQLALLWSYWMDEASADVYGLLNVGPAFAENLVVFLAAMGGGGRPALRVESRGTPGDPTQALDPHPTDILRPFLALGVIETMAGLQPATRDCYAARIAAMAEAFAAGDMLTLDGSIRDAQGHILQLAARVPRQPMQRAAQAIGRFVATTPLAALGGKSIQQIETWDDGDETRVGLIRAALAAGRPIAGLGDDAQLLAACSLAAIDDAAAYDTITAALNAALDHSFRTDPLWNMDAADRLYIRYGTSA